MGDPVFELGMLFCSANAFRAAVRKHAIVHRRALKQVRNYGARVKFICQESGCDWKIYANPIQKSEDL